MNCRNDSHALYRHYDENGFLLYVGITHDPGKRWEQHRNKDWWHDVTRTEIERFPDRESVIEAELAAIRKEQPLWNIAHNEAMDEYKFRCRCAATCVLLEQIHRGESDVYLDGLKDNIREAYEFGLQDTLDRTARGDQKQDISSGISQAFPIETERRWARRGYHVARRALNLSEEWMVDMADLVSMYRSKAFVGDMFRESDFDRETLELFEDSVNLNGWIICPPFD